MAENQNQSDSSGKNGSPKTCHLSNSLSKPNVNEKTKEAKEIKHDQSVDEVACREGYLAVHGKGFCKKSKQCWFRLFPSSPSSRAHLQQYSKAENAKQKPYRPEHVILAQEVNSVACLQEPEHGFVIRYRDESLILSAKDDFERTTWIKIIQKVLLSENQDTFTNVRIPRSFNVHISKTTQIRIGDGNVSELLVEYGSIAIIASNNIRLVRWHISQLRSFGFDANTFMVTAGKNSEHGEGVYSFITKQGEEIHRTVKAAKTKDSSFEGLLPGMGWQPSIPEDSSPPRPYHGVPKYTPFQAGYVVLPSDENTNGGGYACSLSNDPIYEPVGVMYPTDPGFPSRPHVQQGSSTRSATDTPSQKINVKAAITEINGREGVYDDIHPRWLDHSYKNIVMGETAFPIRPNENVIPREKQPTAADESLYATVDCSKKTNQRKDSVVPLVPDHKKVTLPHDAQGYTLVSNGKQ